MVFIFEIASIVFFALLVIMVACGFWSRCILKGSNVNEELIRFCLVRSVVVPGTCVEIESTHTVEIATDDPFRSSKVVEREFPGWKIDFWISETDERYTTLFEDQHEVLRSLRRESTQEWDDDPRR